METNAGNTRITIEKYDPSVYSFNLTALCNPSSPPTVEEFHMIVKKGNNVYLIMIICRSDNAK